MEMSEFYSYMWLREDGTPYYVGKGKGKRAFRSLGHGSLNCPKDQSRILIFPQLCEVDAFESEIELIKLFGRIDLGTGCLRNLTDGGDGISGYVYTEDHRNKISVAHKGRPQSPELIAKRAESLRRYWASQPDCRERNAKISEKSKSWFASRSEEEIQDRKSKMSRLGDKHTPEAKTKMALARKGKTPNKGHHHNESAKAKMSASHQRRGSQEKAA